MHRNKKRKYLINNDKNPWWDPFKIKSQSDLVFKINSYVDNIQIKNLIFFFFFLQKHVYSVCISSLRRVKVFKVDHFSRNTHRVLTWVVAHIGVRREPGDVVAVLHGGVPVPAVLAVVKDVVHGGGRHILDHHFTLKRSRKGLANKKSQQVMAVTKQSIKLTLILWILGPRFPFFAGTSTQTCIPLLSYLFTQLSVDKHCLLKSAKTASSGKILDILNVFLKNKLGYLGKAGTRSTLSAGLRRFCGLAPLSTCIDTASWSLIRSCRIFAIPADIPTPSWRHCTSRIQVRVVQVSSRSVQKGQPWVKSWSQHF